MTLAMFDDTRVQVWIFMTVIGTILYFVPYFKARIFLRTLGVGMCLWACFSLVARELWTPAALSGLIMAIGWQARSKYDEHRKEQFERRNARLHSN